MIYSPHAKTYSIVIGTEPDGAALVDQEQVDVWVADWGHWLRNLGDEPNMEAASVTIETAPDSGTPAAPRGRDEHRPRRPRLRQGDAGRGRGLSYPAGSSTVKAYVSLTFAAAPRKGASRASPTKWPASSRRVCPV
jgi:hypothetical protein